MRERRGLRGWVLFAAGGCLWAGLGIGWGGAGAAPPASTQPQNTSPGTGSASNPLGGSTGTRGASTTELGIEDAAMARLQHQQEKTWLNERHQHMAEDADKLLQLATELKADVDKSTRNETSVSAYNKADAIERLAHDVKQRLKN